MKVSVKFKTTPLKTLASAILGISNPINP